MFSTMLKGGGGVIQTFEVVLTQDSYLSHAEGCVQNVPIPLNRGGGCKKLYPESSAQQYRNAVLLPTGKV